jgi:two-component system phosphate regulon response regulator PhoB
LERTIVFPHARHDTITLAFLDVEEVIVTMKTILLADDEPQLRKLIRTTLDDPAYHILEASNGTEALELAMQTLPELIVLDWMMPGMSGVEVLRALRQNPATAHISVIMLTAREPGPEQKPGGALQTSAYLVKPFSPLELLDKVQEVLMEPQPYS